MPVVRALGGVVRPLHRQQLAEHVLPQLAHGAGDGSVRPGDIPVVPAHQRDDALRRAAVHPQAAARALRQLCGHRRVPVKMPHALLVTGEAGGLSHVVQQHRPAQHRLRRDGRRRVRAVPPHVVDMVAVALVEAHAGRDLRQEHRQHVRIVQQHRQDMPAAQRPVHLRQDALRGDICQQRRRLMEGGGGARFDGKAQHGGKPQRPQDAQGVLPEAALRVAHAPQNARFQILPPAEQVGDLPPPVHGHGVHRQVAAAEIVLQPPGERHRVRAAVVGVRPVGAEGGHLDAHALRPDSHRPVLQPRGDGAAVKQRQHLLRAGGGGHVPVAGHAPQQRVPDAAAHGEGRKARVFQTLQHIFHRLRQHTSASPRSDSPRGGKYRQKSRLRMRARCIIIVQ